MSRHRGLAAAVAAGCLLLAAPAHADWLYLSKEGVARIDEIRKAISPAVLFEAGPGAPGPWYARIILKDVIPPPGAVGKPSEFMSYEEFLKRLAAGEKFGNGVDPLRKITFVALGVGESGPRSEPVTLPESWFSLVDEIDNVRDLRASFGNYDQAYGATVGNRSFVERLLEAIDPDGTMGLKPRGLPPAKPKIPVEHGFITSQIQWLRVPASQRAPLMAVHSRQVDAGRPKRLFAEARWGVGERWIEAIAIARRYELERGFAASATGALAAVLQLATIEPGRFGHKLRPGDAVDELNLMGGSILNLLIQAARVRPGDASLDYDGPAVVDASRWAIDQLGFHAHAAEPATITRVAAGYRARASAAPIPVRKDHRYLPSGSRGRDPQFPVDPSEVAAVALELLLETDALCFAGDEQIRSVVEIALSYDRTVVFPDPRAADAIRLRPQGERLLLKLLRPTTSGSARRVSACAHAASIARRTTADAIRVGVNRFNSGERRLAFRVFRLSGWAPHEQLQELVDRLLSGSGDQYLRERDEASPNRDYLVVLQERIAVEVEMLSGFLDLAKAKEPHLQAAADRVRSWMSEVPTRGDEGDKYVLERLLALRKGG